MFQWTGYGVISVLSLLCLLPFLLVISGSLTSESSIHTGGFGLIPRVLSLDAYRLVFRLPERVARAYLNTILLTAVGSTLGILVCTMTAYALQRRVFRSRGIFALYFYFTTLFTGGLVPWYILMVRYLGLKDTYLAMLLPLLISVFDIIVMRSFLRSVPESLAESAIIDGAGELLIYFRVYLPVSKPAIATIGLFIALRYWNDWYHALLLISDERKFPLQYYLHSILNGMQSAQKAASRSGMVMRTYPTESFKLAMTVVATGPIVALYPFLQRYFVRGLTVGALKG
jgi:putative aldouronate transport system permease protein